MSTKMHIIKNLSLLVVFFINLSHSADLPENHPIRSSIQLAAEIFRNNPLSGDIDEYGNAVDAWALNPPILQRIQTLVESEFKTCIRKLIAAGEVFNILNLTPLFLEKMESGYISRSDTHVNTPLTWGIIDSISQNTNEYVNQEIKFRLEYDEWECDLGSSCFLAHHYSTLNVDLAKQWLEKIRAAATTEIEEIANTIAALTGRETLQKTYRLKGIKLINSFPKGDCIRIHLQARFDTIASALLTEIPNEEMVRLNVVRKMADQLFPGEG